MKRILRIFPLVWSYNTWNFKCSALSCFHFYSILFKIIPSVNLHVAKFLSHWWKKIIFWSMASILKTLALASFFIYPSWTIEQFQHILLVPIFTLAGKIFHRRIGHLKRIYRPEMKLLKKLYQLCEWICSKSQSSKI